VHKAEVATVKWNRWYDWPDNLELLLTYSNWDFSRWVGFPITKLLNSVKPLFWN